MFEKVTFPNLSKPTKKGVIKTCGNMFLKEIDMLNKEEQERMEENDRALKRRVVKQPGGLNCFKPPENEKNGISWLQTKSQEVI